jgi:hypothetical protein
VQSAREAARRMQCSNNLKQLGLALQNYHTAVGKLPPGVISNNGAIHGFPRTTWVIHLFPYIEQQNLYDKLDFKVPTGNGMWTDAANCKGTAPPTAVVVKALLCPSDSGNETHYHPDVVATYARGNYAAFFGNLDTGASMPPTATGYLQAPFQWNKSIRIDDMRDGASNTMLLGECLRGITGNDREYRGVFWYDHSGASQIFTKFSPNSTSPDVLFPTWCPAGLSQPGQNLPCTPGSTNGRDNTASSRSRHSGGVQVVLGDGSGHFISDNVDIVVWQAMGSIASGEVFTLP